MAGLKLIAFDRDDLEVVSAHLQDAEIKLADIIWRPADYRVVIPLDRFDWEAAKCSEPHFMRRRAVLRFERVLSCKARDIDPAATLALTLLAVDFAEAEAPSGAVLLTFADKGTMRIVVECLEVELADLGPSWAEAACPDHPELGPE